MWPSCSTAIRSEFIVGTRVNTQHHDPNLPVEIELRRGVVRDIARTRDQIHEEGVDKLHIIAYV